MRIGIRYFSFLLFCFAGFAAVAQTPEKPTTTDDSTMPIPSPTSDPNTAPTANPSKTTGTPAPQPNTPASNRPKNAGPIEEVKKKSTTPPDADRPLDGVVERKTILDKVVLPYDPIRESDILWEKRIWRVVDIREKLNQAFAYPEMNFMSILLKGIQQDSLIKAYSNEDDKFSHKMNANDLNNLLSSTDTINVPDLDNPGVTHPKIIHNDFNTEDIKRYRIKEVWFFDKQASILKVRILGISPLRDVKDDAGNFLYEQPLFWVYYPDCREYLSRYQVFVEGNDANPMSWEDLFELRRFSSYISKESNVQDRRLQDYATGIDLLLDGEKIKQEIFNWEHDLWSY